MFFTRLSEHFMMDIIYSTAFGLDIDSKNNPHNEIVKIGNTFVSKFFAPPDKNLGWGTCKCTFRGKIVNRYVFPSCYIQTVQLVYFNILCYIYVGNCLSVIFPQYFGTSLPDRIEVDNFNEAVQKAINERRNAESVISQNIIACLPGIVLICKC